MNKLWGILFFFVLMLGCASMKPERVVNNNIFFSSADPKIEIEVDNSMVYKGKWESEYSTSSRMGDAADTISVESYNFLEIDGEAIGKAAYIKFNKLQTDTMFWIIKCTFAKGGHYVKIGGNKFCQVIRPMYSDEFFNKKWVEERSRKGYTIPKYYMVNTLTLERFRNNVKFWIIYGEGIPLSTFEEFRQYYDPYEARQLTDRQKAFLDSFDKRFKQALRIKESTRIIKKSSSSDGVIARDDRFIKFENGVVKDPQTDLEWVAGPDRDTNWYDAKKWIDNLKLAGGGWRMPTIKELGSLYQQGVGSKNMTPFLKTTGRWAWSGETKGSSSAWYFTFRNGYHYWNSHTASFYGRGFAVRSRK